LSRASRTRQRRRARARAGQARGAQPAAGASKSGRQPGRSAVTERRSIDDQAPEAPWGSFPLVEIVVLGALALLIGGFFVVQGSTGALMIGAGLALGSLAGLEVSIREHLSGYRSHTLILAGAPAVLVIALLFYFGPERLSPALPLAGGAVMFVAAILALRAVFRNSSGGLNVKIRGFRG
jgi:hypothetical protein